MSNTQPLRAATDEDWRNLCVIAAGVLARGVDGEHVRKGESWAWAIGRVASDGMIATRLGRPKGAKPDAWIAITYEIARRSSLADDGLVAAWNKMRLPISALPERRKS